MKIIKPYAKLMPLVGTWMESIPTGDGWFVGKNSESFTLDMGVVLLRHIEWCARISHRSEDAVTGDSWRRLLQAVVIEHGDWSVTEHATVSCDFYCDRGITHELVRHRLFSYTQESTRFVNYEKKMRPAFVYPNPTMECKMCLSGNEVVYRPAEASWVHYISDLEWCDCEYHPDWLNFIEDSENAYKRLIKEGWTPQLARSAFPNALASRIVVTGNLRNWRHFFIMRTSKETHPQMKEITIPLLAEFKEKIPLLFDDIEPEQKQSLAMQKGR